MKMRRRPIPLLLLLLPTLASALAVDSDGKPGSVEHLAKGQSDYPSDTTVPLSPSKPDIGTKDAPVDGLDGKPHAGPFVDQTNKRPSVVEDLPSGKSKDASTSKSKGSSKEELDSALENDGVMVDPNRAAPVKGTTGTGGGVSEKDRERKAFEDQTGRLPEKKPETPKEAPHLPASEEDKYGKDDTEKGEKSAKKESTAEKPKGAVGFEKPVDLPDKPHDMPHPVPPSLPKSDPLEKEPSPKSKTPSSKTPSKSFSEEDDEANGVIQPFHSFVLAITMILVSEVGDKTFLVAALMAMRHDRLVVFSAAFSALIAMTVLSAVLGHAVPTLISERLTHFAAAILFFVFGLKMLREGYVMSPDEGVGEEMREVEEELEEKEHDLARLNRRGSSISPYMLESGRGRRSRSDSRLPVPPRSPSSSPSRSPSPTRSSFAGILVGVNNLCSLLLSPAWVQTFVMTFLGEWGDRSQIATIAMAAGQDYWWVTGGAISGHAICTAAAVIGGKAIAGRVSMRVVTLGGATAFLVFGLLYLIEATYSG